MKSTVYNDRYKSKENYWEFRPSSMAYKILELYPPMQKAPRVLEIGCGEGGTAVFLARNGYNVTAFDLSSVGVEKTASNAAAAGVPIEVFQADINEFEPKDPYDIIFSSGTVQYLQPEKRKPFFSKLQECTSKNGLHVVHTFVIKPFVEKAPDAEDSEHLWSSGELLILYQNWITEAFVEEIKECNSSGILHRHVHNRIWTRKP